MGAGKAVHSGDSEKAENGDAGRQPVARERGEVSGEISTDANTVESAVVCSIAEPKLKGLNKNLIGETVQSRQTESIGFMTMCTLK